MIVGMDDDPSIGEYERLLLSMKTTARKELILLHPYRSVAPGSTRLWLKVSYSEFAFAPYLIYNRIAHGCIGIFMLNYRYAPVNQTLG